MTANATTAAVTPIASGDQNPLLAVAVNGVFGGLNPVVVPVFPTGALFVGDGPVTVNVVVATFPGHVAVTVYTPGGTDGTLTRLSILPL